MKSKWTDEEIDILKSNLNIKNIGELSILLDRTEYSIINKLRLLELKLNVYKSKTIYDYNWIEIQEYYDDDKFWKDVVNEFKISNTTLCKAVKEGFFKTRGISESNILSSRLKPRTVSEETKKKISISRIKYLKEHPDQVPYLLNHYSKGESYPEKYFDKIFKLYNLKYEKQLQISIYQLDFAFIEKGINIEIDGEQHHVDNKIVKSNTRKDIFLNKKGWDIVRIRWSHYQKMTKNEKKIYIKELVEYINNKIDKPIIINRRYVCVDCGCEIFRTSTRCSKCNGIRNINKNRPSLEQLLIDVSELGYCGTGRKYGVSDNCIRKWIKK